MVEPLPEFDSELEWQIDRRARIQNLLFDFYSFLERYSEFPNEDFDCRLRMGWMVDAAFSLWRSAFLTDTARDPRTVYEHTKEFLKKVLEQNAITFADDHRLRGLVVGYYNANAKYRIERLFKKTPQLLDIPAVQEVDRLKDRQNLSEEDQSELWDIYYSALAEAFAWFKADWHAKKRPAVLTSDEKPAELSEPDGSTA